LAQPFHLIYFFWQASVEVEEMKNKRKHLIVNKKIIHEMNQDVDFGMTVSGFVMYFIILTTGTVLFKGGIHQIDTVEQAAMALKPLAGNLSLSSFCHWCNRNGAYCYSCIERFNFLHHN
jgi:Mn2+/Fe2+ NRAMP family transporter